MYVCKVYVSSRVAHLLKARGLARRDALATPTRLHLGQLALLAVLLLLALLLALLVRLAPFLQVQRLAVAHDLLLGGLDEARQVLLANLRLEALDDETRSRLRADLDALHHVLGHGERLLDFGNFLLLGLVGQRLRTLHLVLLVLSHRRLDGVVFLLLLVELDASVNSRQSIKL